MADENFYRLPGDEPNPYAPPEAGLRPVGPRGDLIFTGGAFEPFTISGAVDRGYKLFREQMGLTLGSVLSGVAVLFVFQLGVFVVISVMQAGGSSPLSVVGAQVVLTLLAYVLQFWLGAGVIRVLLKVARGEPAGVGEIFQGGRYLFRCIVAAVILALGAALVLFVIMLLAGLAVALAAGAGGGNNAALSTALVVAMIGFVLALYFYVAARFGQAPFLIVDRDLGALDSLTRSFALTRGRTIEMLGFYILCFLIYLAGFLACLVGGLFTLPLSATILSVGYLMLAGGGKPAPRGDLDFPEFQPWTPTT